MIPIDRKSKEPQVELIRLLDIKDTQNRDDRIKADHQNPLRRGIVHGQLPVLIRQAIDPLPRPLAGTMPAFGAELPTTPRIMCAGYAPFQRRSESAGKAPAHPVAQGFAHDQLEIAAWSHGSSSVNTVTHCRP